MQQGEPSQTAKMTAVMRAYHNSFGASPKILEDDVAMSLTGLGTPEALAGHYNGVVELFTALSNKETADLFVRRTMDFVCMRSRLFEEQLKTALADGIEQVIVLGAGLDTTAYKFADQLQGVTIYEIDHPDTQQWKRNALENSGIAIPDNLQFIGIDFETQTLTDALDKAGVNRDLLTMMSWLGVVMYLTDDGIRSSLSVLSEFAKGSRMVMDFVMPDYEQVEGYQPDDLTNLYKVVAEMGEPMLSKLGIEDWKERFATAGFSEVTFYSTEMLVEQFMDGQADLYTIPAGTTTLLSAKI